MMRIACVLALCVGIVATAIAAKPVPQYVCSVTVEPPNSQAPDYNWLTIDGTAPRKAEMHFQIQGEAVWSGIHNIRGVIDGDLIAKVLYPGAYVGTLVAFPNTLIAECPFTVE